MVTLGTRESTASPIGRAATTALLVVALLLVAACTDSPPDPDASPAMAADATPEASAGQPDQAPPTRDSAVEELTPAPPTLSPSVPSTAPASLPLRLDREIDGDSFVASDGREYRVGMINTPERGTCGADEATARTASLLAGGFAADAYEQDTHGRGVARIATSAGDLGVLLAQEGLADDRYLEQFRHENPPYADELERAFAQARAARAGLYGTCWADHGREAGDPQRLTPANPPADGAAAHSGRTGTWSCHPAYQECLPDGPDLDCREVGHQVVLLGSADPFRLDGNSLTATDGVGCDTYEPWAEGADYPYYR